MTILLSLNHGRGGRGTAAADVVEKPVFDHLRHETVDHLNRGLACVLGRLPQLVFRALVVRV